MVAYSFQRRFILPIRSGLGLTTPQPYPPKRQTIRAIGKKRHARPGEQVQLYFGLRTSGAFMIGTGRCTSAASIRMQLGRGIVSIDDYPAIRDGDLDAFAQSDGFADWNDLRKFWDEQHDVIEFEGVIVKWEPAT